MANQSSGKILIIDAEKPLTEYQASYIKPSNATPSKENDEFLHDFQDADAAKVAHFFQDKLNNIGEIITRSPSNGPPRLLTIKCNRSEKVPKVRAKVEELKSECDALNTETVELKSQLNKWSGLEQFIKENTNKDILFYLDINKQVVVVVSKDFLIAEKGKHKLQVHLGIVKTKERPSGAKALEASASEGKTFQDSGRHNSNATASSSYKGSHNRNISWKTSDPSRVKSARSSDDKFNFEASLGSLMLKVYEASIIRLDVDVIVNAANDCLAHGGGVARVIADAAGSKFNQESWQYIEKHGNLKVSENCVTSAGDLRCKNVIHAVGPQWVDYRNKEECLQALYNCIWNVFETCYKKNYEIVAIPAISAGIYGVPKGMCAKIYIKAAMDFSKKEKYCPKEVHFVDVDVKILQLVKEAYEEGKINPDSLSPRNVIANDKTAGHYPGNHGSRHRSNLGRGRDNESSLSKVAGAPGRPGVTQFSTKIEKLADEDLKGGGKCQKFRIGQNLVVKVYTGEIQKAKVDAIACGISKDSTRTGFIISVLKKEGGHDYNKALEKLLESRYWWKINDVHVTVGGNLQAFKVLYLVTERLLFVGEKEIATFRDGLKNLLKKAVEEEIGNIAIPLIGAGSIENDPKKLHVCCQALVQTLSDFSQDNPNSCIKELHLVNKIDTVFKTLVGVCNQAAEIPTKDEEEMDDDEYDFSYSSDDGDKSNGQSSDSHVYEEIGNFNSFETSGASGVVSPIVSYTTEQKETDNGAPKGNLKIIFVD